MSTWILFIVFLNKTKIDTQQVRDIPSLQICIDMKDSISKPFVVKGEDGNSYNVAVSARCVEKKQTK